MYNEYEHDKCIPCTYCWKGHMAEVKVHIYLKIVGEDDTKPLISTYYFCTACQKLTDEL